jgi:molecular chaperone DnaK (HSP70)
VQPSYGLTDEQVETMILESFDYAERDLEQRQVIEARNEASTILTALEKGRKSPAWAVLTEKERQEIARHENKLLTVKEGGDYHAIRSSVDALNQATMRLAELMMDSAVASALKGKTMESADLGEGPAAPHPIGKAEFE